MPGTKPEVLPLELMATKEDHRSKPKSNQLPPSDPQGTCTTDSPNHIFFLYTWVFLNYCNSIKLIHYIIKDLTHTLPTHHIFLYDSVLLSPYHYKRVQGHSYNCIRVKNTHYLTTVYKIRHKNTSLSSYTTVV